MDMSINLSVPRQEGEGHERSEGRSPWTKPSLTEVAVADVTFAGSTGTTDCAILT
jgi:hypothetical protein